MPNEFLNDAEAEVKAEATSLWAKFKALSTTTKVVIVAAIVVLAIVIL